MSKTIASSAARAMAEEALAIGEEMARRRRERPLDWIRLIPWQRPLVSLSLGLEWESAWGPGPTCPPKLIAVIASNQVGKSTAEGVIIGSHVTGRSRRFTRAGEVWGGMPRLADSVAIQRKHVADWLGTQDRPVWHPKEPTHGAESLLRTGAGWVCRLKAFEQDYNAWESGTIQAAYLDEPPPDRIVAALDVRTLRHDGFILTIFTPLRDERGNPEFKGTRSALYKRTWGPWQEYRAKHPKARWGEVRPGVWVFTVGAIENTVSRGGYLPDARVEAAREELIRLGRPQEAAVRYDGDWLDISTDRIIPVERIVPYSKAPPLVDRVAWIDTALSKNDEGCESAVAVAGRSADGNLYLLDVDHGMWGDADLDAHVIRMLDRHGCPSAHVQRTNVDEMWMQRCNRELRRRGLRACITAWPEKGALLGKVERAKLFAGPVKNGQVHARPEHLVGLESFGEQAALFSASYRGLVDTLDACMGALMRLTETALANPEADAMQDRGMRRQSSEDFEDDGHLGGYGISDSLLSGDD